MKKFLSIPLFILCIVGYSQKQDLVETFPEHRDQVSLIYHPQSKALLFIGGFPIVQDSTRSNVWKWNGNTWTEIDATGPGSRAFFQGTLNTKTGEIFHFGGNGAGGFTDSRKDLWAFDGKKWSSKPSDNTAVRHHHRIVYADHLDAIVLYGGFGADNKADTSTWIIRNGKFTPLHIPGPGIRYQYGMVYDKNRKKAVLYGGGDRPNEHWEFDGKKWEKILNVVSPGIKFHHHMAYDETLKAVILHGGWINLNSKDQKNWETPITWMWDGKVWKKIAEERIFPMAIAYDPNRKSVIAYGYDEGNLKMSRNLALWELKNGKWNKITDYGKWNVIEHLEKHLKQKPDDLMALLPYANELRRLNRLPEAEVTFKKIVLLDAANENYLVGLIQVLYEQNKEKEAGIYFIEANALLPESRRFYSRVGAWLLSIKKYQEGIRYLEKANEMQPQGTDFYNVACAYSLLSNTDKAFESLNRAIENGFNSKRQLENNGDLESLKSDSRWKLLVEKLK